MTNQPGEVILRVGMALVVGLSFLASARAGVAQQAAQTPVFGTGVDLVRIDVSVLDKDGRPVTGLAREDFVVEEGGRVQAVESFEPVVVRTGRPSTPDEPPRLSAARLRAPSEGRCLLLFVDDIHIAPPTMARVQTSIRRFLEAGVREGDWVTLVAPQQQLWWTARNGWEYKQLAGVVGRLTGQGRGDGAGDWVAIRALEYGLPGLDASSGAVMAGGTGQSAGAGQFAVVGRPDAPVKGEEVVAQIKRRTGMTLGGLQQALESLVRLRGQKSLLLLSEGFLLLPKMPGYQEAIDLARRANVAIHFVDVRGAQTGVRADGPGSGVIPMPGSVFAVATGDTEGIAEVTGGTVFAGNDPEAGLRRVAERSDAYYLLGYQPDAPGRGERQVKVRVKREGVEVRARTRYYVPEPPKPGKRAPEAASPALVAMRSLADTTDLALRVSTLYFEPSRKGEVATMLAAEVLPLGGKAGVRLFKLVSEARARDGGLPVRDQFEGSPQVTPGMPLILARQWQLPPGVWQVRLVVEDTTSGRIGTAIHTFEVPDPKAFRLSTPILTAELEDPNGKRQPKVTLTRTFRSGSLVYCQYNVYGGAVERHDWVPHALGSWTLRKGEEVVREGKPTLIQPAGDGRLTRTLGLSLEGATPGEYALTLTVRDEKTDRTLSRTETFTVIP